MKRGLGKIGFSEAYELFSFAVWEVPEGFRGAYIHLVAEVVPLWHESGL